MSPILRRSLIVTAIAVLSLIASAAAAAEPTIITFGVYTSDKPSDMYRQFKPALEVVETAIETTVKGDVEIKLQIYNSYDAAQKALVYGEVDFVRFGPASYIIAKQQNEGIRLLAIEENDGSHLFNGVIFCRTESSIQKLEDLAGRAFAFGDDTSTIGRYLSQAELVKHGVFAKDLSDFKYLGRHDTVATAVLHGRFDAGAVKEGTFKKYEDKGLRVLNKFDNVTKPWVARSGLDGKLFEALRDALLGLNDEKALGSLGNKTTGFAEVTDKDYDFVRDGMRASEAFFEGVEPTASTAPIGSGTAGEGKVPAAPADAGVSKVSAGTPPK
jgi:phosphonate transport system substrate-binding protein